MPLERTEPADEKQHDTDPNIGEYDTHPDLIRQWVHEGEHPGGFLGDLLHHDADTETHEGFGEVNDSLPD